MILSGLSAFSLAALSAYLLAKRKTASSRLFSLGLLLLAGLELCDGLSLQPSMDALMLRRISQVLESFLPGLLLLISLIHARSTSFRDFAFLRAGFSIALALSPQALLVAASNDLSYSPELQSEGVLFLGNGGYWFYLAVMTSYIASLVQTEATFSSTRGADRYRIKFEVIGLTSILAVMIFYYSQGLLYRTINMNLIPVRSGVFVISSLLIGYSAAFRGNGVRVVVSRHVFYRSITLLAVGIYLIGLGVVGEGMKYFGDAFGRNVTVFLAFAGGIFLLLVFLSEKARRRVKVFASKHFFAQKYDYRDEWMKFTSRLAPCLTLPQVQGGVLSTFRDTFGLDGVALYMLHPDGGRLLCADSRGMPDCPAEARISDNLSAYFIDRNRVWNPFDREYAASPPELAFREQTGASLIIPLINKERLEGVLVFGKQTVSYEYTYEDYDLMKSLGRQAALALANSRLSEELTESREMAAMARISSFVIHDLKNLASSLSLVVDNAEAYIGDPDFQQDAIATMRGTLAKMKRIMQRLKSVPKKNELHVRLEDIDKLSRETVDEFARARPGLRLLYNGAQAYSRVDGEEIRTVLVNLVQNAIEASNGQGAVIVETARENGAVCVRVSDAGCGMTEEYVKSHLFKPFRTTKKKGLGIGLYQSKQIVEAHGGRIEVNSAVGKGAVFSVHLPLAADATEDKSAYRIAY